MSLGNGLAILLVWIILFNLGRITGWWIRLRQRIDPRYGERQIERYRKRHGLD
jgi:hypothetical protein